MKETNKTENLDRSSKAGIQSIEILICIGIFAFCAAICIMVFVKSAEINQNNINITSALAEAKNVSEEFKSNGITGIIKEYDSNWNMVENFNNIQFRLELIEKNREFIEDYDYVIANLRIYDVSNNENLIEIDLAYLGGVN